MFYPTICWFQLLKCWIWCFSLSFMIVNLNIVVCLVVLTRHLKMSPWTEGTYNEHFSWQNDLLINQGYSNNTDGPFTPRTITIMMWWMTAFCKQWCQAHGASSSCFSSFGKWILTTCNCCTLCWGSKKRKTRRIWVQINSSKMRGVMRFPICCESRRLLKTLFSFIFLYESTSIWLYPCDPINVKDY